MSEVDDKSELLKALDDDEPPLIEALSLPLAKTLDDVVPALREVRARIVTLDADGAKVPDADEARQTIVLLEDPSGFATQPTALSTWAYAMAMLFDGQRSARQIAQAFLERYGYPIQPQQVLDLQNELEQAMFLCSRRFERAVRRGIKKYLEDELRPMAHAGTAYPKEPEALRTAIGEFFTDKEGPGDLAGLVEQRKVVSPTMRAIMLPHIDMRVGGATYACGYAELFKSALPDLIFILGVAHQNSGGALFHVSTKDFDTPLGALKVDREMARRLQSVSGVEHIQAEIVHRTEHSIEFQAVLLQALLAERFNHSVQIVPILCGGIEAFLADGTDPLEDAQFARFTAALRKEIESCKRNWCVLCSVDLSHVGPEFGHSSMIDERLLPPLQRADKRLLDVIEKGNAKGVYEEIYRTQNSRHVDAVLPLLAMLQTCRGLLKHGRLLQYQQMLKPTTHSAVSYAAMAFE